MKDYYSECHKVCLAVPSINHVCWQVAVRRSSDEEIAFVTKFIICAENTKGKLSEWNVFSISEETKILSHTLRVKPHITENG